MADDITRAGRSDAQIAEDYLEATQGVALAIQEAAAAAQRHAKAQAELERDHALLVKMVQPRCGSATKPHRRLFGFTRHPSCVVLVQWDDQYDRGAAFVVKPE